MKENLFESQDNPEKRLPLRPILLGVVVLVGVLLIGWALTTQSGSAISSPLGGSLLTLIPAAFVAGVLSFLSPCTLPILPAYFAFTFQARRQNVVLMSVSFFFGLATTLTVLGASATAVSLLLLRNLDQITLIGGLIIIAFGVMSLLGRGFAGPQIQERPASTAIGSYLYGATFALGWTACIGPILGAILTLLATQGLAVIQGAFLSLIYALGLGFPLILVSVFFSRLGQGSRYWSFLRGRGVTLRLGNKEIELHTTNILSGLLLITMGFLLASGQLSLITEVAARSDLSLWVLDMEERVRALLGLR